jgi:hypothetical protein
VRESHLAYLSVGSIGQTQSTGTLDNMPATLEEENRRLWRVVVREERYPAALRGSRAPALSAAARMSSSVRSG